MTASTPLLIERDHELGRIGQVLAAAARGAGACIAIVGPAGIGKTSLVRSARAMAGEAGFLWLAASGAEFEREYAFGVVRQLFERHLRSLDPDGKKVAFSGAARRALTLFDDTTDDANAAAGTDADVDATWSIIHGLYWLCANLSEQGPLALALDDAHWADRASLDFIAYLARRAGELSVAIVTASRPQDATGGPASPMPSPTVLLSPAALSESGVARMMGEVLAKAVPPTLASACHRATAGNPYFCQALMSEIGGMDADDAAASHTIERSGRAIADVVVRKLGALSAPATALARAIAVLGPDADLRRAALLAELPEPLAAREADGLAARGVLRLSPAPEFAHPLVRTAVYEQIPVAERALLHRAAAERLRSDGMRADRVALHLQHSAPGAQAWVVDTLRAAARSMSATDPDAARALLDRALAEQAATGDRAGLLHELGVSELNARREQGAIEHLRLAHEAMTDVGSRAAVARDLSLALGALGHYAEAATLLDRTLSELSGVDADAALGLQADLHQGALMDPAQYALVRQRYARLDGATTRGVTRGERAHLAALATEGSLRMAPAADVRDWATRAFEGGLLEDLSAHASLWGNAAFPLIFADGFDAAGRAVQKAIDDARWRSSPIGTVRAHAIRATLRMREGNIPEAEADARTAVDIGLQAGLQVALMPLAVLVEVLTAKGEFAAARAALAEAGQSGEIPNRFLACWVLHARGWLHLAQGLNGEACADFSELGRRGEEHWWPWNPGIFAWRSGLAIALHRLGDMVRTGPLADEELRLATQWGAARAIGIAQRTLGLVSASADGVQFFRSSVATLAGSGARLEHAQSLVALGARLRRDGRRNESRDALQQGMAIAHACGALALTAFARDELVATGARPRRAAVVGVEALTASELRVARLAAEGLTNREIAQALFLTLRTVEVHLTHAYSKLQIEARTKLAGALDSHRSRG